MELKQELPIGTVATRRPWADALRDAHSCRDGQSGSDGMKRQPPAIGGVGLIKGLGAATALMVAVKAVNATSVAVPTREEAISPDAVSRR